MVVCGGCGKNMVPKVRKGRIYWACDNRTGTCATPSFAEDRINLRINEMLQTGVFKDEIFSRHVALLTEKVNQAKLQIDPKRIEKLQAEIKAAKKNHLFLPDDWKPDAMEGIREREAELKKLEAQLQSVVDVEDLFKRTRDALEEGIRRFRIMGREPELRDIEQTAGKARHRAALRSWLKKIT